MLLVKIETTRYFDKWFARLKDKRTRGVIQTHIKRMESDNFGMVRHVGQGIYEKKINYASGYRLYYVQRGDRWIILVCGGNKSTQKQDIELAQELKKGIS